MRNSGRSGQGRGRGLSDEDEELWAHAARSLRPLAKAKSRVHPAQESLGAAAFPQRLAESKAESAADDARSARASLSAHPVSHAAARATASASPPLGEFDRRKARKLGAGRLEVEARLDLHGMRQGEAHSALRGFLRGCFERGIRWVLVITGKGSPSGEETARSLYGEAPGRGVLRRSVPAWLAEPDMRAIVVSFTTASVRHGGEGALYVQLRSRHKSAR